MPTTCAMPCRAAPCLTVYVCVCVCVCVMKCRTVVCGFPLLARLFVAAVVVEREKHSHTRIEYPDHSLGAAAGSGWLPWERLRLVAVAVAAAAGHRRSAGDASPGQYAALRCRRMNKNECSAVSDA